MTRNLTNYSQAKYSYKNITNYPINLDQDEYSEVVVIQNKNRTNSGDRQTLITSTKKELQLLKLEFQR